MKQATLSLLFLLTTFSLSAMEVSLDKIDSVETKIRKTKKTEDREKRGSLNSEISAELFGEDSDPETLSLWDSMYLHNERLKLDRRHQQQRVTHFITMLCPCMPRSQAAKLAKLF